MEYINAGIDFNNEAFYNSNIPLKRSVAGVLHADEAGLEFWSRNDTYVERLDALTDFQATSQSEQLADSLQYSYLVGLAGFERLEGQDAIVGLSHLAGNVSWISPYTNETATWSARTLAHELGHNDGFRHTTTDHEHHHDYLARHDGTGFKCGKYASIMNISGTRTEPFFSDTQVSLLENGNQTPCGEMDVANSAQVYRDLANNKIRNAQDTFRNLVPVRQTSGFVSVLENINSVQEGQNLVFDVVFDGAEKGDSVSLVVKQKTADKSDFESKLVHIMHNGTDNVYAISVGTKSDDESESTEVLEVELVFANGVQIDENQRTSQGEIVDSNDSSFSSDSVNAQVNASTTPVNNSTATNSTNVTAQEPVQVNETAAQGGSTSTIVLMLLTAVLLGRRTKLNS